MTEQTGLAIRNDMSMTELGNVLVKSGFFQDSREVSQAIVKVLAGQELGFGPIASMTGINVISGRISLSANLIAAAIKRSGVYNFQVCEISDKVCRIEFFQGSKSIGMSEFTIEDARRAGTKNLEKFPRNMLYARAMSNGARWYTPDVFSGPIYTPEELGADVNEDGEVITATFSEPKPQQPRPQPVTVTPAQAEAIRESAAHGPTAEQLAAMDQAHEMTLQEAEDELSSENERYGDLQSEDLRHRSLGIQKGLKRPDLTPDGKAKGERKLRAIRLILDDREARGVA